MATHTVQNQQLLLDLFRAYFDTRKNKGKTQNALAFAAGYEDKLFALYEDIIARRYTVWQSICFIVNKPVKREVFAADFRDRIVHHLIYNYINPIFEKHFIRDSYSCRIGKGTSEGISRVDHFIRSCSQNYQKDCWILKLDIRGYFMSMDKDILYTKIASRLRTVINVGFDVDLILYLIQIVIYNDATNNCCVKTKPGDWIWLPKSKSLFFTEKWKGFPIGNLTSQLFANIYLDAFDHFVHKEMGIKQYGRYVDDMVFVHKDRDFLHSVIIKTRKYLFAELGLEIHPKKIYLQYYQKGVYFLGAYIKPWRIYIGKRTKQNFYDTVLAWNQVSLKSVDWLTEKESEQFISSMNSYLGIMKQFNTTSLRQKIVKNLHKNIMNRIDISENFDKIMWIEPIQTHSMCEE